VQAAEAKYKQQMDDLAKQLTAAKEKGRQQEEMQRKIS
jgi:hypothetical protein